MIYWKKAIPYVIFVMDDGLPDISYVLLSVLTHVSEGEMV
jgi:hypothetical protein